MTGEILKNLVFYSTELFGLIILMLLSAPDDLPAVQKKRLVFLSGVILVCIADSVLKRFTSPAVSSLFLYIILFILYIFVFPEHSLQKKAYLYFTVVSFMSFGKIIFSIVLSVTRTGHGPPSLSVPAMTVQFAYAVILTLIAYRNKNNAVSLIHDPRSETIWNHTWLTPFAIAITNNYFAVAADGVLFQEQLLGKTILFEILLLILQFSVMRGIFIRIRDAIKVDILKNEAEILSMESKYYKRHLYYIEDSARIRHDFKQVMITMQSLLAENRYNELQTFMDEYFRNNPLPESTTQFCYSSAVNAVLNHYHQKAEDEGIRMSWKISIPDTMKISETDLCIILGNLLGNAVKGCLTIPKEERYINLKTDLDDNGCFYITQVNSYDGYVNKQDEHFVSRWNGSGIGLNSIELTARKYDGMAQFQPGEKEFISNVMMYSDGSYTDN